MSVTIAFLKAYASDARESFHPTLTAMIDRAPKAWMSVRTEESRAWLICDWLARGVVFAWLESAGFHEPKERLRSMKAITRQTANDAFAMLTIFDTEIILPVVMAGRIDKIEAETQAVVETEQQCGVYAAMDFYVNAAVEGAEAARLFSIITGTAARIVSACIQKNVRDDSMGAVAQAQFTIERVERSVERLVAKLVAVS